MTAPKLELVQEDRDRFRVALGGGRFAVFTWCGGGWHVHERCELYGAEPHPWLRARGLPLPDEGCETEQGTDDDTPEQPEGTTSRSGPPARMFAGAVMVPKHLAPKKGPQAWPPEVA